ncbi:acyltransferase [Nocardioides sp. Leaf307]|uniref:acyltransferase n=1 Tax=Nocardioides sp. Leaf307 TaxID=1736331 RepID=UPI0007035033|nr:acyltransferase [Nocardioides sp. Leaf307]KQQ42953.1 hypothetical protein ASF50_02760 [Nocardioides sp. Leaf307]
MPWKDLVRRFRDETLPRERLRRAHPAAVVAGAVLFKGDPARTELGAGVFVQGPTSIFVTDGGGLTGASLSVGPRTYIGEFNNIRCAGAAIRIGADCLVSQHVTIVGSNHGTAAGRTVVSQDWSGQGVVIGDDVWIGAGAVVLPDARVGDGVVIAANSVVRGAIPDYAVVAGAPARVIGQRS